MAGHNLLGKEGESMASVYMEERGYTILHHNWRKGRNEIDLIALKNDVLHFVEVKTRRTKTFGWPEEAVNSKKFNCLKEAADEYIYLHPQYRKIQFDILSIMRKGNEVEYFFIEDVYL